MVVRLIVWYFVHTPSPILRWIFKVVNKVDITRGSSPRSSPRSKREKFALSVLPVTRITMCKSHLVTHREAQ